jgi:hypothetical protein
MIQYQEIYQHIRADRQVRQGGWSNDQEAVAQAQVVKFTTHESAPQHSLDNLEWLLDCARGAEVDVLVVTPNRVQMLGQSTSLAMTRAFPVAWLEQYREWTDFSYALTPRNEASEVGECSSLYMFRDCVTVPKSAGVYEVTTGRRMRNRQEIIERFWRWGFPALRGRPLTVGQIRWSGSRDELEMAEKLYTTHYLRREVSEVAKKICQAYTTVVRSYAWPGNW